MNLANPFAAEPLEQLVFGAPRVFLILVAVANVSEVRRDHHWVVTVRPAFDTHFT